MRKIHAAHARPGATPGARWRRVGVALLLACAVIRVLTLANPAHSQTAFADPIEPGFTEIAVTAPFSPTLWSYTTADDAWPELPGYAIVAEAVSIDPAMLGSLQAGALVLIPADANATTQQARHAIRILSESDFINGDRVYQGELLTGAQAGPLVLTVGAGSVFAYVETDGISWQLFARRDSETSLYQGWLYQASALPHAHLPTDFHVPSEFAPLPPSVPTPQARPLQTANTASGNISSQALRSGTLEVSQSFANTSVVAGRPIEAFIDVRNSSAERHRGLNLTVYFLLENSSLINASSECRAGWLGENHVLSCAIGDMAPGELRRFHYQVATTVGSRPYVYSTVRVGELQNDAYVNVVNDVVTDSDGDGISDFNEGLQGTNPLDRFSVNEANSVIDVMALYTPDAAGLYGGHARTRINQLIAIANQIYADSGVHITLRPVYHGVIDIPGTAADFDTMLQALTFKQHPAFADVDRLRTVYGADLVMLFRPQGAESARCGLANLGGYNTRGDMLSSDEKDFAYSTIAIDCPVTSVVAHELGHNMGLTHSRLEDGTGGTFDFATGHGVNGRFVTVMAYPGAFNTDVRIARFSNPRQDCLGLPCGVDGSDPQHGADAVRTLNLVRQQIASYFPTQVPMLPTRHVANLSGGSTDASIALAARVNRDLAYVSTVRPQDDIAINASLAVDSRHIGKQGNLHVLIHIDGQGFLQLDRNGNLLPWDGSAEDLQPFAPAAALRPVEYVQVIEAVRLGNGFINRRLQVFVAYSVTATGEVIYTAEPLVLDVVP